MNILYRGDNLEVLRRHFPDDHVDLCYLDPPFNLKDTKDIAAYLDNMSKRLVEVWRTLKPTGSFYLHCDATVSHYLKIFLDGLFGRKNFRRKIIWRRGWVSGYKTRARNWIRNHDILLYYVKGSSFTFNKIFIPHPPGYRRRSNFIPDDSANPQGKPLDDVWLDIYAPQIVSFASFKEKAYHPQQKPLVLLERIITASSNPGDIVLDPFCGGGTTLVAASRLGRKWMGIDQDEKAIAACKSRLRDGVDDDFLVKDSYAKRT